ncbi:MAG: hypothetical protein GY722_02905 [bacterium]|nr:hypothetical protein [bacterium]
MVERILIPRLISTPPGPGDPVNTWEPNPYPTPPSGPQIEAEVEIVNPPAGFNNPYVARCVVPVAATPTLPRLYLNGQEAQVDGMTKNSEGKWDNVLVSGFVPAGDPTETRYTVSEVGAIGSATPHNDDLSGLRLEMKVANIPEVMEADFMGFAPGEVIYDGSFLNVTRYWAPFVRTAGGSEECMMAIVFVTRRADAQIYELDFLIHNGKCDVTESPFDRQSAIDGNVHFDYIKLTGLTGVGASWGARTLVDRPLTNMDNQSEPELVSEIAGAHHAIGPRQGFSRRVVIGDLSLFSTHMLDVAQWRDRGTAYGANSYFMLPTFGETKCFQPHPPPTFQWGGRTGRAAMIEFDRQYHYEPTLAALASGGSGGMVDRNERGWQHPTNEHRGNVSGGDDQETYLGWHTNVYAFLANRLDMESRMERGGCYVYTRAAGNNIAAGQPCDVHAWATNNSSSHVAYDSATPGAANKYPWDAHQVQSSKLSHTNPLFKHPGLNPNPGTVDDETLLPTGRPWNGPESGRLVPWRNAMFEERGGVNANPPFFEPHWGTHSGRQYHASQATFWHTGDVIAREHIRAVAGFYVGPNHYGVQGFNRSNSFNLSGKHLLDMPASIAYIVANGYENQVPFEWYRALSRRTTVQLMRYCLESDTWRMLDKPRWEMFADIWDMQTDSRGEVNRAHSSNLGGDTVSDRYDEALEGPTNVPARTGAAPDTRDSGGNPVPGENAWDVGKTWMTATVQNTGVGMIRAVFDNGVDSSRFTMIRGHIQNWWNYCWSTQPTNNIAAHPSKYLPVGESNRDLSFPAYGEANAAPIVSTFTQFEDWQNDSEFWYREAFWYQFGCWHMILFSDDPNWLERDMLSTGQFNPTAGLGNQSLEAYCEWRWTSQNNVNGGSSSSISMETNGTQLRNAAPALAAAQVLLGLNESWMAAP